MSTCRSWLCHLTCLGVCMFHCQPLSRTKTFGGVPDTNRNNQNEMHGNAGSGNVTQCDMTSPVVVELEYRPQELPLSGKPPVAFEIAIGSKPFKSNVFDCLGSMQTDIYEP
jgi:ribosomal protein S17